MTSGTLGGAPCRGGRVGAAGALPPPSVPLWGPPAGAARVPGGGPSAGRQRTRNVRAGGPCPGLPMCPGLHPGGRPRSGPQREGCPAPAGLSHASGEHRCPHPWGPFPSVTSSGYGAMPLQAPPAWGSPRAEVKSAAPPAPSPHADPLVAGGAGLWLPPPGPSGFCRHPANTAPNATSSSSRPGHKNLWATSYVPAWGGPGGESRPHSV